MRTIRVEVSVPVPSDNITTMFGGGGKVNFSTEAIIGEDAEASDGGSAARQVLDDFIAGYVEDVEAQ